MSDGTINAALLDTSATGDQKVPRTRKELKTKGFAYEYDLTDPTEILRLYRECRGYLHTCHLKHGTDWEGRKFAMAALDKLANGASIGSPVVTAPSNEKAIVP